MQANFFRNKIVSYASRVTFRRIYEDSSRLYGPMLKNRFVDYFFEVSIKATF